MNEQEFRDLMQFLYDDHIGQRIADVQTLDRERSLAPGRDLRIGFHEYWRRATEACRLLRFIQSSTYSRDSFEESTAMTFTEARLTYLEEEVIYGIRNHNRLADTSGFLGAFDSHLEDIIDGLKLEHLPKADVEILKALGSQNSESELAGLVAQVKSRRVRQAAANCGVLSDYLQNLESRVQSFLYDPPVDKSAERDEAGPMPAPAPRRSRRWWKGLGTIARGCALSGANIGLAAGVLVFPVEPSTQSWGAVMSSVAGIGDVICGVGELLGE